MVRATETPDSHPHFAPGKLTCADTCQHTYQSFCKYITGLVHFTVTTDRMIFVIS